ncbi:MAG TPA: isoprenylcysteine carboxylmethyltransferase family protein [Candidatus Cybelea sp.]|nr:isoprenylcysteine carboxylmethyltransferase family protein [Candidatus Cybelea sp.]
MLVFTWPYGLFFWAVFAWAFVPEFAARRREGRATPQDAGSMGVLIIAQSVGMFAAFTIARTVPLGAMPYPRLCFSVGVLALIAGSLLRRHCQRMLGASFTGAVVVREDHAVVERGAYRFVRHPSYTAASIMFFGIGLALANWIGLATLLALVLLTLLYRVNVEERTLIAVIGDRYRGYMRRTKRFVPFVF